MKTSSSSVCKAGLGFTGLILLSVAVGAGWARAETFRHGGSAVTIDQSGGGASRSKVIRYKDGQKIVTQDGNSTDITIQGGSGSLTPDYGWRFSEWSDERFDRQRIEERFSRDADDYSRFTVSREREAFKQRMGSRFSP